MKATGKRTGAPASRAVHARNAFRSAADTIGPVEPGMSVFAVTRGQFSMIDAVLHVLDCVGPSAVSVWTWTVAEYEVQCLQTLMRDRRITSGRLIIDANARTKNRSIIAQWEAAFGVDSVRYVMNHAKIATVESASGRRVLLRGSMNLNFNPRFEQLDVSEGGPAFDLVRELEDELAAAPCATTNAEAYAASQVGDAWRQEDLIPFQGLKTWAK